MLTALDIVLFYLLAKNYTFKENFVVFLLHFFYERNKHQNAFGDSLLLLSNTARNLTSVRWKSIEHTKSSGGNHKHFIKTNKYPRVNFIL